MDVSTESGDPDELIFEWQRKKAPHRWPDAMAGSKMTTCVCVCVSAREYGWTEWQKLCARGKIDVAEGEQKITMKQWETKSTKYQNHLTQSHLYVHARSEKLGKNCNLYKRYTMRHAPHIFGPETTDILENSSWQQEECEM